MRKLSVLFCIVSLVMLLNACKDKTRNQIPAITAVQPDSTQKQEYIPEDIAAPNYGKLKVKRFAPCKLIKSRSAKEEDEFLNTNINYFETDSFPADKSEPYFRYLIKNDPFLEIEASNLNKDNFKFSVLPDTINNYGHCIVGKYFFPIAINSAQRRVVIIINEERKEVSIWTFDDVRAADDLLYCDFNVRGKHVVYRMKYSVSCKRFINVP